MAVRGEATIGRPSMRYKLGGLWTRSRTTVVTILDRLGGERWMVSLVMVHAVVYDQEINRAKEPEATRGRARSSEDRSQLLSYNTVL